MRNKNQHGVFSFHWENKAFDYAADYVTTKKYRMEQIALYVDDVSDETADDWYRLIQRCAATKSKDMATFPAFGEFLHQLSKAKPDFVFALARREDADVLAFLPVILTGLFESEACDKYSELLEDYLDRNAYLAAIARHCRWVKKRCCRYCQKGSGQGDYS